MCYVWLCICAIKEKESLPPPNAKHVSQRKTICRLLYPNYFSSEKWKYVDTVEEDSKYLSECNTKNWFFIIMEKEWIKLKYVVTVDEGWKCFFFLNATWKID